MSDTFGNAQKVLEKLIDRLPVISGLSYERDERRWRVIIPSEFCPNGVPLFFSASYPDPLTAWLSALCTLGRIIICHLQSDGLCNCKTCDSGCVRIPDTTKLTPSDFTEICAEGVDVTEYLPSTFDDGEYTYNSYSFDSDSLASCRCLSHHLCLPPRLSASKGCFSGCDQEVSYDYVSADDLRTSFPCVATTYTNLYGNADSAVPLRSVSFDDFVSEYTGIFPLADISSDVTDDPSGNRSVRCPSEAVPSVSSGQSSSGENSATPDVVRAPVSTFVSGDSEVPAGIEFPGVCNISRNSSRSLPHAKTPLSSSNLGNGLLVPDCHSEHYRKARADGSLRLNNPLRVRKSAKPSWNGGKDLRLNHVGKNSRVVSILDGNVAIWQSGKPPVANTATKDANYDYTDSMKRVTTDYTTPVSPQLHASKSAADYSMFGDKGGSYLSVRSEAIRGDLHLNAPFGVSSEGVSSSTKKYGSRSVPLSPQKSSYVKSNGDKEGVYYVDDEITDDDSPYVAMSPSHVIRRRRLFDVVLSPLEMAESLKPWYSDVFWVTSISRWRTTFLDEFGTRHTKTFTPYVFGGVEEAYYAAVEYKRALDRICSATGISEAERFKLKRNAEMSLKRKRLGRSPRAAYTSYLSCPADKPVNEITSRVPHSTAITKPNADMVDMIVDAVHHTAATTGRNVGVLAAPIPRNVYQ
ncbi:hypothetical protein X943_001577 [Babesia divergens]|uniref:AP2/ERF domain-containing protein n=1 Tax=Babesia divergens TaxID=32595 RepID=A0AAD9GCV1_BABDI|nr:hypothetical protein X943_001577 [Babesia divergens]